MKMKVKVENDIIYVYKKTTYLDDDGNVIGELDNYSLKVNALDLAKALKPYLDSIENCEVKK